MTDKLDEIFEMQVQLNDRICVPRGITLPNHLPDGVEEEDYWEVVIPTLNGYLMALDVEKAELISEMQYKWWKDYDSYPNQERIQEELIDMFHFLLSAMIAAGMNAEDIYAAYMEKNQENFARQDGKVKGREDYNAGR